MSAPSTTRNISVLPLLAATALIAGYVWLFMHIEDQWGILGLVVGAAIVIAAAKKLGWLAPIERAQSAHPRMAAALFGAGALTLLVLFFDEHFALLMLATVMLYAVACLGLTIQFGFSGVMNFAGAAFFGIGAYTAAVLGTRLPAVPDPLVLVLGGAMATLVGTVLLLPILRTRGHYAALITIAFGILFRTFIEVNDVLGGPQGLKVAPFTLFGWQFNTNIEYGEEGEISFYLSYALLSLLLLALAMGLVRRLEYSWTGLTLDAVRLDETASAVFGIQVARARMLAFSLGNFLIGVAGACMGMMTAFVAPTSFTLSDSLILVSIVLLGGVGNFWSVVPAAALVTLLPEKLQLIEEYRFLLFAILVILILLFRPAGLFPRRLRKYRGAVAQP